MVNGCTTFRLNPFRRMDNSSNTTIGLKKVWSDITSKKNKDFRRIVAPVLFFVISDFFLKYLDDLPVVGHVDFIFAGSYRYSGGAVDCWTTATASPYESMYGSNNV